MIRDQAVRTTLGETGKAILFTSLILMSGFLVFTLSSFGGTVNMGALTALTLGVALVANVTLLPALLYRYAPVGKRWTVREKGYGDGGGGTGNGERERWTGDGNGD